jgi:hypothetical protein
MPPTPFLTTHQRKIAVRYHATQPLRHAFDCGTRFLEILDEQMRDGVGFRAALRRTTARHDEIVAWTYENVGLN